MNTNRIRRGILKPLLLTTTLIVTIISFARSDRGMQIVRNTLTEDSTLKKVQLFNDGCKAYKNGDYLRAIDLFSAYKKQWPDDIEGYYRTLLAHMSLDPSMERGLAIQDALEIVRLTGKDEQNHKAILLTTYQYLMDYYSRVKQDAAKENFYLRKIGGLGPG